VTRVLFIATVLLLGGPVLADKGGAMSDSITITQSTVGAIDDARIGIMRVSTDEEYALPDGTKKTGAGARISIENGPSLTVGVGSTFTFKGHTYECSAVTQGTPRGTVTLRRTK
jgi:hypothetical protein